MLHMLNCDFCVLLTLSDTEPPLLKCIPIYTLYLDPGKTSVKGIWPVPKLQDTVQDIADVIQLTGPVNGTELEPGQYVANYIARDRSGNISPNCSMIINVEGINQCF